MLQEYHREEFGLEMVEPLSHDESWTRVNNNLDSQESYGKGNWERTLVLRKGMCVLNST